MERKIKILSNGFVSSSGRMNLGLQDSQVPCVALSGLLIANEGD
jgi:hypothetical protein